MASFTVIVHAEPGMQTERHIPTLDEAEWFARDRSATGKNVTWTEVWEGTDPAHREGAEPLRYYEFGERVNRRTRLPWSDD